MKVRDLRIALQWLDGDDDVLARTQDFRDISIGDVVEGFDGESKPVVVLMEEDDIRPQV